LKLRAELVAPGLLGPVPPLERAPRTPTLDLLLERARVEPAGADLPTVLLARFGAEAGAPYALAADDPDWDRQGWWLHADPVHLRPDRDLLRLFDARHLGISRAEADALVAALNAHFAGDGLHFHAPAAQRWYLRAEPPLDLATTPMARVQGCHIDGHLPTGADAGRFAALMSEAQMLLFQHAVNASREAAGRPAVNGLWCWGGGVWAPPTMPPQLAVGSAPLLHGLAQAAGIAAAADTSLATLLTAPAGRVLMVQEALADALHDRDADAWAGAAERLDAWLAPLPAALRSGALAELRLYACDGACRVVRRAELGGLLPRLPWRRRQTLAARATLSPQPPV
jgi:hypothetical protein